MDLSFHFDHGTPWLDLPPTVYGRFRSETFDRLSSPARLADWLEAVQLTPRRRPDAVDLDQVRQVREALWRITRATAEGRAVSRAAVRTLNEILDATSSPRLSVTAQGLRAARPATTLDSLGRIVRQAVEVLSGPGAATLRVCADETCSGVFTDESGRRRWCSDTRCGSRARVSAHRARQRQ
jgi:predicted RNA-binding Zn ribbon-like protein